MKQLLIILIILSKSVVYAQLNENFADGDFTNNPTWTDGNVNTNFIINESSLRSNSVTVNSNFYISTENVLALNCSWNFSVNLKFSTSGLNYVDIYLISDRADLKSALINGYFVRIGNTDDEISLYKRSGKFESSVKIIDGVNSSVSSSNNVINVRVSRNSSGLFTLERKIGASNSSYYIEGTAIDSSYISSTHFGIFIQQSTTSFSQKHFFDDIQIESLIKDTIPPVLTSVTAKDSNTVEVIFSEAMDSLDIMDIANFSINNTIQISQILTTSDRAKFLLKLVSGLNTGNYTLSVSNIKDINGNPSSINYSGFDYIKPYSPRFRDIVVNEIFADPSPQVELPAIEFVELHNISDQFISLKNWKFSDSGNSSVLEDLIIDPYSFVILCAKADTAEYKQFGKTLGISPWPSLNNTGELLSLISSENSIIDSVNYSDTWYQDPGKKQGGWALERKDPQSKCEGIFNWRSSIDIMGGTPGKENSVYASNYDSQAFYPDSLRIVSDTSLVIYFNKNINSSTLIHENFIINPATALKEIRSDMEAKVISLTYDKKFLPETEYILTIFNLRDCSGKTIDSLNKKIAFSIPKLPDTELEKADTARIIITEIFADPSPEIGLPLIEFIEIFNSSKDTIDLDGWTINDISNKATIRDQKILPHEYLILCPAADTLNYRPYGRTVGLIQWPSLNNASEQLVLKSFKNRIVDSVAYSDKWYKNNTKKSGGWSLERIDLSNNLCNDLYGWSASTDTHGGTPGRLNSINKYGHADSQLKIDSISYTSDSTVVLYLNHIPDTAHLKSINFAIDNGIGKSKNLSINDNYTRIYLEFGEKFLKGDNYVLTVDSFFTCQGKLVTSPYNQISFSIPLIPEIHYPVVINEFLADPYPTVGLPEVEYVELFNPTDQYISLKDLTYGDEDQEYKFNSGEIAPGSYLILCAEKDTLSLAAYGEVMGLPFWTSLNNERGSLFLKNNKDRIIQKITYNSTWYKEDKKAAGGFSLEMIDPLSLCSGSQNWQVSIDASGGSPGKKNSVYNENPTLEPLKLLEAVLIDSVTISLIFNKNIDSLSASVAENFNLNNGIGAPITVLPVSPEFNEVILKLRKAPARGHTYRIHANIVKDCKGQEISSEFNYKELTLTPKITTRSILVSEILFNPRKDGADFIEIYNNENHSLNLQELAVATILKDTIGNIQQLSTKQLFLEPGGYLAISADPDNIKKEYYVENQNTILKVPALPAFNDDHGNVVLVSDKIVVDHLSYEEKMHFQLIKNFEGISLERSNFALNTNASGNFRSATAASGFATPGYQNSQYSPNPIGHEQLELTSKTFSPDNDGFEDLLQMSYNFNNAGMIANVTIFNDKGVLIKKLLKNSMLNSAGIITWDGLNDFNEICESGIYVIYMEAFDTNGTLKKFRKAFALAVKI